MSNKIFSFGLILSAFLVFLNPVFAISENITQINFTSSPQTINVNANSAVLSTQTQNAENASESVSETTTLNYTSTSETGQFSDANISVGTCNESTWSASLTLTLASTRANKGFCYKDTTPGTYTLTISAEGKTWTGATQEIIIKGEEAVPEPDPTPEPEPTPDPEPEPEPDPDPDNSGNENPYLDITVENSCTVEDIDGITHVFPNENSPSEFLSICALVNALKAGKITELKVSNHPLFGLSIKSINNTEPGETEFWGIFLNDEFANCGIGCLAISKGDILSLVLTDWVTQAESSKISLRIIEVMSLPEEQEETPNDGNGGSGGGGQNNPSTSFDIQKALDYLKNVQDANGSFGDSGLYTDWVAVAYGAQNVSGSSLSSLLEYLNSNNELSSLLTDNERRAMAILALDKNPYSFNGVNYIKSIVDDFDGTQFGDADLINDDIFALIPLKNAGYTSNDDIIKKDVAFLISKQNSNGSWVNSVDITAATIQALKPFESIEGVSEAILKAKNYLIGQQGSNGGWENSVFSTSWAMQAESALDESWAKNGKSGLDYLATQQVTDGAVSPSSEELKNRIWATSYAIAAASLKSWGKIMQSVSKPASQNNSQNNSQKNSNDSGTGGSETNNPNPQTPIESEPVICPVGHFFSATTGKPCTMITTPIVCPPGDLFNATNGQACTMTNVVATPATNQNNNPPTLIETSVISEIQESAEPLSQTTTTDTTGINSDTLAATAIDALPEQTTTNNTIPIVLGTLSGIILLYFIKKLMF